MSNEALYYKELMKNDVTAKVVNNINHLLPQLSSHAPQCTIEWLHHVLDSGTRIFVATDKDTIIGTVLLCETVILVGQKDWIEDVVVDANYRGRGVASHLMAMAEEASRARRAKSVNLTSNPDRGSALKMYSSRGYKLRDTGVFRLSF